MKFHDNPQNERCKPRQGTVLTRQQAEEIFRAKSDLYHGFSNSHAASVNLASKYNVSSKTIRDIWKGRSWLNVTFRLWDTTDRPERKTLGRPKGKKDSRPRQLRTQKRVIPVSQGEITNSFDAVHVDGYVECQRAGQNSIPTGGPDLSMSNVPVSNDDDDCSQPSLRIPYVCSQQILEFIKI